MLSVHHRAIKLTSSSDELGISLINMRVRIFYGGWKFNCPSLSNQSRLERQFEYEITLLKAFTIGPMFTTGRLKIPLLAAPRAADNEVYGPPTLRAIAITCTKTENTGPFQYISPELQRTPAYSEIKCAQQTTNSQKTIVVVYDPSHVQMANQYSMAFRSRRDLTSQQTKLRWLFIASIMGRQNQSCSAYVKQTLTPSSMQRKCCDMSQNPRSQQTTFHLMTISSSRSDNN